MNGFEKHGIGHLSASNINLWAGAPDVWCMSYLAGKRTPFGPAAKRGTVIEDAVVRRLVGDTPQNALNNALEEFDRQFLIPSVKSTKERAVIEPMIEQAVEALEQYGEPDFPENGGQHKIEIMCEGDGWSIPVIGYLDFVFPQHGLVIDLKTTNRMPAKETMSAAHQLQRAIYSLAKGNQAVKFLYVSKAKSLLLETGNPAYVLARAKRQIFRIERFLSKVDSAEEALSIIPHDPTTFYWSDAEELRREFFGD